MSRFTIGTVAVLTAAISSAWFVRPDGTGAVTMSEAMDALGLNSFDTGDVNRFKAAAKAGEYTLHLVRDVTYEIPCTRDGGETFHVFKRSQKIDADLNYKWNGANDTLQVTGYGAGFVHNNVYCPGSYKRLRDENGDIVWATLVSGTYRLTIDGAPLEDVMRRP